jgi:hypothetical protein
MDRSAELIVTSRPILFLSGLMFWLPHKNQPRRCRNALTMRES